MQSGTSVIWVGSVLLWLFLMFRTHLPLAMGFTLPQLKNRVGLRRLTSRSGGIGRRSTTGITYHDHERSPDFIPAAGRKSVSTDCFRKPVSLEPVEGATGVPVVTQPPKVLIETCCGATLNLGAVLLPLLSANTGLLSKGNERLLPARCLHEELVA